MVAFSSDFLLLQISNFLFSEVLTPFYPSVDLKICPVFHTPAPEVVPVQPQLESVTVAHSERQQQHEPEPEYQPVTGGGGGFAASFVTLSITLLLAMWTWSLTATLLETCLNTVLVMHCDYQGWTYLLAELKTLPVKWIVIRIGSQPLMKLSRFLKHEL